MTSNKKPSSYCKIATYLQHEQPILYYVIENLCLFGAIGARKDKGVTFLVPDTTIQKNINNTMVKDAPEAVKMVKSLIIGKHFDKSDEVNGSTNLLGYTIGDKYEIGDLGFKKLSPGSNISVFSINMIGPMEDIKGAGMYSGGNDSSFGHYEKYSKSSKINDTISMTIAEINRDRNSIITDPLTLTTISVLYYLKEANRELYNFLILVNPCSPLYGLFILSILNETELKGWTSVERTYDKTNMLETFCAPKPSISGYNRDTKDRVIQMLPKCDNRSETLLQLMKEHIGEIITKSGLRIPSVFDTGKNTLNTAVQWVLYMQEFCYYFTIPYIDLWSNINKGEREYQSDAIFNIMFKGQIQEDIEKRGLFISSCSSKSFDGIFDQERFCSNLSFYTSNAFACSGININELSGKKDTSDDNNTNNGDNTIYGWGDNVRPDLTTRTSYFNKVSNFWKVIS
jgi:hypothetical protein